MVSGRHRPRRGMVRRARVSVAGDRARRRAAVRRRRTPSQPADRMARRPPSAPCRGAGQGPIRSRHPERRLAANRRPARPHAIVALGRMTGAGGLLVMSLRHGPGAPDRSSPPPPKPSSTPQPPAVSPCCAGSAQRRPAGTRRSPSAAGSSRAIPSARAGCGKITENYSDRYSRHCPENPSQDDTVHGLRGHSLVPARI